jgi:DNA polymerase I
LAYEALLAAGIETWRVGERIRVYRKPKGEAGLVTADDDPSTPDARDYDVEYYVRLLRSTFAERLARAFTPADFEVVFADADQFTLFAPPLDSIRPVLRMLPTTVL